jgi:hypothetical protein
MNQRRLGRKIITLSVLIVLGIAYSSFLHFQPTLTGLLHLDGMIGVVLYTVTFLDAPEAPSAGSAGK